MTKEEKKKEALEFVRQMREPTKENALKDMRASQALFLTKNGKFYSSVTEEYLQKMQEYGIYCKVEEQENWCRRLQSLVDCMPNMSDDEWLNEAWIFESSATLMEKMNGEFSWDEVRDVISEQGHTGMTMSLMSQTILEFSPYGISFVDHIVKPRGGFNAMTYLKRAYNMAKKKEQKTKEELGSRLVKSLNAGSTSLNNN